MYKSRSKVVRIFNDIKLSWSKFKKLFCGARIKLQSDKKIQDLVSIYNEYTIRQRHLQTLMKGICKIINNIALPIMSSLFLFREKVHNILNFQILSKSLKRKVRNTLETVSYTSPFFCANLLESYKSRISLHAFIAKWRKWNAEICECRLRKHDRGKLGFI